MRFRFWGVRGSLPCPISPGAFQAKVSSILQRVRPSDLDSPESRERFLAGLPPELFGLVGGNTTCLEVGTSGPEVLVVDGGTGIRDLGLGREGGAPRKYHIFLSHFHADHLQGLPFFSVFFREGNQVTFYSPVPGFEALVRRQMEPPYFPLSLEAFPAQIRFHELSGTSVIVAGTEVRWRPMHHPGGCMGYRFSRDGHSLVFCTDAELRPEDFVPTGENLAFFGGVDALVLDAQYTVPEALDRADWGHSSSGLAVEFALDFGAKTLYLFHHEPDHDDAQIEAMGRMAQWYADLRRPGGLKVRLAREGREESAG